MDFVTHPMVLRSSVYQWQGPTGFGFLSQYATISHNLVGLPLTMGQFIDDDDLFEDNVVAAVGRARIKDSRIFASQKNDA